MLRLQPLILGLCLANVMLVVPACSATDTASRSPFVIVLGIAQDAGFPQAGCGEHCCAAAWRDPEKRKHVSCLGIVDPQTHQRWMIDATPDFRDQLRMLDAIEPPRSSPGMESIFLTHAHIGHYTGLMFIGHESIGAKGVPVYAMPRMQEFLTGNGPWDQLVRYNNIELRGLTAETKVRLNDRITITPLRVPHREEYSEVVGFRIAGPNKSVLFIPDIDKWERWDQRIEELLAEVDIAYLDGTFYADGEIPGREMSQIPHPFISESMKRFGSLPPVQRGKIRFIHLNHTNPALDAESPASRAIRAAGFAIAGELERVPL